MLWIIESPLLEVQGCIERVLGMIKGREYNYQLTETSASKEYQFTHVEMDNIGRVKISILPNNRTELEGTNPDSPADRWLVQYLPNHFPWTSFSQSLQSLLQTYSWQIEHNVFDLSAKELFQLAYSKDEVDFGWEKYGLDDIEIRKQALEDMKNWRNKVFERRLSEFNGILGMIESQIRGDRLPIRKPDQKELVGVISTDYSATPWNQIPDVGDDRGIIKMWCENHTNKEIGQRYHKASRSITNIICRLRKQFPDAKIPTAIERKKLMIR